MKGKLKSLEELIAAVQSTVVSPDEEAPFGFAQRVVAEWKAIRTPESVFAIFNRLLNPAVACSWAIAAMALIYTWQAGVLPSGNESPLGGLYDSSYADEGEEMVWPAANG